MELLVAKNDTVGGVGTPFRSDTCDDHRDISTLFVGNVLRMTGLLNPKIVGKIDTFACVILVLYLGHGIFIR